MVSGYDTNNEIIAVTLKHNRRLIKNTVIKIQCDRIQCDRIHCDKFFGVTQKDKDPPSIRSNGRAENHTGMTGFEGLRGWSQWESTKTSVNPPQIPYYCPLN
jgi:hypothetical protein